MMHYLIWKLKKEEPLPIQVVVTRSREDKRDRTKEARSPSFRLLGATGNSSACHSLRISSMDRMGVSFMLIRAPSLEPVVSFYRFLNFLVIFITLFSHDKFSDIPSIIIVG
ncbi:hypothetical protein IEQ34_004774 [Dendrobium chrysotoxum]|uniref:Uncharacterized protein n=1 Tax=Dendrobium chrysotoxum TaxID=161865 RepID=A0AAV7H6C1_DENCH|nr:hypothetical protein IEQ34_004774 [Dendrobium chrysotoxum]